MTDRLLDIIQGGAAAIALWSAISLPVAIGLGRIIRRRETAG
ncbi:hypothetical protein [Subtercola boreus]|nr:hypothetical protein [Subtercola boreus]TQL46834.1 hypothetical protein FB464_3826 [Subtercola boreus]